MGAIYLPKDYLSLNYAFPRSMPMEDLIFFSDALRNAHCKVSVQPNCRIQAEKFTCIPGKDYHLTNRSVKTNPGEYSLIRFDGGALFIQFKDLELFPLDWNFYLEEWFLQMLQTELPNNPIGLHPVSIERLLHLNRGLFAGTLRSLYQCRQRDDEVNARTILFLREIYVSEFFDIYEVYLSPPRDNILFLNLVSIIPRFCVEMATLQYYLRSQHAPVLLKFPSVRPKTDYETVYREAIHVFLREYFENSSIGFIVPAPSMEERVQNICNLCVQAHILNDSEVKIFKNWLSQKIPSSTETSKATVPSLDMLLTVITFFIQKYS